MNTTKKCNECNRFGINEKDLDNWYSCDDEDWKSCIECQKNFCNYCFETGYACFFCSECGFSFCFDCSKESTNSEGQITQYYCDQCVEEYDIETDEMRFKRIDHEIYLNNLERPKREFVLKKALERNGLELRADSKLCNKYINTGKPDLDYIIRRMGEVKFLYEYCDFKKVLDKTEKYHIKLLNKGYFPDASAFKEAEGEVLQTIGGYPKHFPWENEIAIRKIQRACYNWLWKPETKDGKTGINLRLGLRDLD